jgi:hypothetical protein
VKFQQHNSSSKNGEEMRRVGVSFIPKKAKRGQLDEVQVLDGERGAPISRRGRPN